MEISESLEFVPRNEDEDLNAIISAIRKYKVAKSTDGTEFENPEYTEKIREELARKMTDWLNISGYLDKFFEIEIENVEEQKT